MTLQVCSLQSFVLKWGKISACSEKVHSLQSSVQKWGKISAWSEKVHSLQCSVQKWGKYLLEVRKSILCKVPYKSGEKFLLLLRALKSDTTPKLSSIYNLRTKVGENICLKRESPFFTMFCTKVGEISAWSEKVHSIQSSVQKWGNVFAPT